jgi:hypothetical protein
MSVIDLFCKKLIFVTEVKLTRSTIGLLILFSSNLDKSYDLMKNLQ